MEVAYFGKGFVGSLCRRVLDDLSVKLYQRTIDVEVEVFRVGMELLLAGNYRRIPQPKGGNLHYKKDFKRLVRAMTTSDCKVKYEA